MFSYWVKSAAVAPLLRYLSRGSLSCQKADVASPERTTRKADLRPQCTADKQASPPAPSNVDLDLAIKPAAELGVSLSCQFQLLFCIFLLNDSTLTGDSEPRHLTARALLATAMLSC